MRFPIAKSFRTALVSNFVSEMFVQFDARAKEIMDSAESRISDDPPIAIALSDLNAIKVELDQYDETFFQDCPTLYGLYAHVSNLVEQFSSQRNENTRQRLDQLIQDVDSAFQEKYGTVDRTNEGE